MKKVLFPILACCAWCLFTFTACNSKNKSAHLTVRMTDAPGDFQQVNVDVLEVQVHSDNDWISLPTNAGVYDLLTLQNDVSAVLVNQGVVPAGKMTQFRLLLGGNNSVMVDSVIYDLKTPSAEQSGLKLNVKTTFLPNELYEILIDFDAEQSVVKKGNGDYSLKPVLKLESVNQL